MAIDEIQLVPGLFRALKLAVDLDRRPGRFIVSGSTRLLALPALSDSLAGRMEVVDLWPFSQGELRGRRDGLLDALFAGPAPSIRDGSTARDLLARAAAGGFPPALARRPERRGAWFRAYVQSVIERDVAVLVDLERLDRLPRLLQLLAARAGGLLQQSELANDAQMPVRTLANYLTWLERVYLVHRLPAWSTNLTARAVKMPKMHVADSGVLAALLDIDATAPAGAQSGQLLESFVAGELRRQQSWAAHPVTLHHFRSPDGAEVDIIAEDRRGRIVGIEVKSSVGIDAKAFRGLRYLRDRIGERFVGGVVLHAGAETLPFGDRLWSMPMAGLWLG